MPNQVLPGGCKGGLIPVWSLQSVDPLQMYSHQLPHFHLRGNVAATLKCIAMTADSLCDGDLVEKKIRSTSNWGLLPLQVHVLCVYVCARACV